MVLLNTIGRKLATAPVRFSVGFTSASHSRFTLSSLSVMTDRRTVEDIEELHQRSLEEGSTTYIDPETGYTVFTELTHLKRGFCCGNQCRHCPYGFERVRSGIRRQAKVKSGDKDTTNRMVKEILQLKGKKKRQQQQQQQQRGMSTSTSTTTKNVPYTRQGDGGTSQLGTGERRSKTDCNFEALGTVDELCSFVGVVHAHLNPEEHYGDLESQLLDIMSRLFDIGSHVAKPREGEEFEANGIGDGFDSQHIDALESWINQMTEDLPELTSFILPTGAIAAAHLHTARTVCRRTERRVVPLVMDDQTCDPNALKYLNRLSDYFFVAARWVNFVEGKEEIQYQRPVPGTTQRQRVARSLKES